MLNHVPVEVKIVRWEVNRVQFRLLPEDVRGVNDDAMPASLLISLFIDGMETNALPLRLLNPPDEEALLPGLIGDAQEMIERVRAAQE